MAPNVRSLCKSIGLKKAKEDKATITAASASSVYAADFYSSQRAYDKRQQQKEEDKQMQLEAATEQRQLAEMQRKWQSAFYGEDHNQVMTREWRPQEEVEFKSNTNNNNTNNKSSSSTSSSSSSVATDIAVAVVTMTPAEQETREEKKVYEQEQVYEGLVSCHGNENSDRFRNDSLPSAAAPCAAPCAARRPLSPEQQMRAEVEVRQRAATEYRKKWLEADQEEKEHAAEEQQLNCEMEQLQGEEEGGEGGTLRLGAAAARLAEVQALRQRAQQAKDEYGEVLRAFQVASAADMAHSASLLQANIEEEKQQKKHKRRQMLRKPWTAFKAWADKKRRRNPE